MSDGLSMTNLPELLKQLETYVAVSSQPCAEALNKKARDLAYRAAENTPKLNEGAIRADLRKDPHLVAAMTSIHLKGQKLPKGQFKIAMRDLEVSREVSARYLRSGWAPCIEDLGGKYTKGGGRKKGRAGASKKSIKSYAEKATSSDPIARIIWVTEQDTEKKQLGAEAVAQKALDRAVDFVIADMEPYITKKLAEVFE